MINSSSKLTYLDNLLEDLRKDKTNKVLIFSQMLPMLDILEDYLTFKSWKFQRMDGTINMEGKQQAIEFFAKPNEDCFVFLLSTKAGLGINLSMANNVVIYDSDFNPMNDLQAMDRCHRIGQKREVKIYRLLTRKTYEKKLITIASKKLGLTKALLYTPTDDFILEDEDLETLLKEGAYSLFLNDEEEELLNQGIAEILGTDIPLTPSQSQSQPKYAIYDNISKQSICSQHSDSKVNINDADFWDKLLPGHISPASLNKQIYTEKILKNSLKIDEFLQSAEKIIVENQGLYNQDVWDLIKNIEQASVMSSKKIEEWSKQN
jgi:hypothetical protein